jgi:hypothetical protein
MTGVPSNKCGIKNAETADHTRNTTNTTEIDRRGVPLGGNNVPRSNTIQRRRSATQISTKQNGETPNTKLPMLPLNTDAASKIDAKTRSDNSALGHNSRQTSAAGTKNAPKSVTRVSYVLMNEYSCPLGVT